MSSDSENAVDAIVSGKDQCLRNTGSGGKLRGRCLVAALIVYRVVVCGGLDLEKKDDLKFIVDSLRSASTENEQKTKERQEKIVKQQREFLLANPAAKTLWEQIMKP